MLIDIIYRDVQRACKGIQSNFFEKRKVLITGASGLLGTHVLAYLVSLKNSGIPIDVYAQIFSPPPAQMLELLNLAPFKLLKIDLTNNGDYDSIPSVDLIIHTAGYAQPLKFMANPVGTLQINVLATMELLKKLKGSGDFIFASSAEVYAGLTGSAFKEDHMGTTTPYHPRSSYIEGKRCGEAVCHAFRSSGIRTISVRLGDVYGPGTRKHDKRALFSFIEQALIRKKIELLDSGVVSRTYCYVADALRSLISIVCFGKHEVYNVGGYSVLSVAELARLIGSITNVPVTFPEEENKIDGSPQVLGLDLTRLETEFGMTKQTGMDEGLKKTIDWQRNLYLSSLAPISYES